MIPAPLRISELSFGWPLRNGLTVIVKALAPALKTIALTIVFVETETSAVLEAPKVAVSPEALGTVDGVQLAAIFQSREMGLRSQVALPAKVTLGSESRSTVAANTLEHAEGQSERRPIALRNGMAVVVFIALFSTKFVARYRNDRETSTSSMSSVLKREGELTLKSLEIEHLSSAAFARHGAQTECLVSTQTAIRNPQTEISENADDGIRARGLRLTKLLRYELTFSRGQRIWRTFDLETIAA